jgi:hypothetical protein
MITTEYAMASLASLVTSLSESEKKKYEESIWYAEKALNKQRPLIPLEIYDENVGMEDEPTYERALIGACPCCHHEVQLGMKFCMECGQAVAIDWEESNDYSIENFRYNLGNSHISWNNFIYNKCSFKAQDE